MIPTPRERAIEAVAYVLEITKAQAEYKYQPEIDFVERIITDAIEAKREAFAVLADNIDLIEPSVVDCDCGAEYRVARAIRAKKE